MNALANSQAGELEKFLKFGFPNNAGPVTYRRYTGQEKEDEREAIIASPPDILLTNYVMLELLLTRPLREGPDRGGEGPPVPRPRRAPHVPGPPGRRRRAARPPRPRGDEGDAASRSSARRPRSPAAGTVDEQKVEIAAVASRLFGATVEPQNVVGETLVRSTAPSAPGRSRLGRRARAPASSPRHRRPPTPRRSSPIRSRRGSRARWA